MKYNPLDGDRAANYYDSLPEEEKEGVMSLDEALGIKKRKKKKLAKKPETNYTPADINAWRNSGML